MENSVQSAVAAEDRELLTPHLAPGEVILWTGRGNHFRSSHEELVVAAKGGVFIAFGFVWTSLVVGIALKKGPDLTLVLFPLFGIFIIGTGIWLASFPLRAKRQAERSIYAVTSQRAVILSRSAFGHETLLRTFRSRQLAERASRTLDDGTGDIVFELATYERRKGNKVLTRPRVGFLGIDDVKGVDQLLHLQFPDLPKSTEQPDQFPLPDWLR